jgi:hypothetical protein
MWRGNLQHSTLNIEHPMFKMVYDHPHPALSLGEREANIYAWDGNGRLYGFGAPGISARARKTTPGAGVVPKAWWQVKVL